MQNTPITYVTDLDGTLIKTDILVESALALIRKNFLYIFLMPLWLMKGKVNLKEQIAKRADIDVSVLPYNKMVIEHIRSAREKGHKTVLATASHKKYADLISKHLGLFDVVIATDGGANLSGKNKAALLEKEFSHGFSYIGNEIKDLAVWKYAKHAIAVDLPKNVMKALKLIHPNAEILKTENASCVSLIIKAMRPYQWVKNLLLFVPLLAAHKWGDVSEVIKLGFCFVSFSLCASSAYIMNDLLDLEADRKHRSKKNRPFASGGVSITTAALSVTVLLAISFALATIEAGEGFTLILLGYFFLTLFYSCVAKKVPLFDVIILSNLYTIRVFAGGVAVGIAVSNWLLIFSMFIFLSLAFMKRYSEMMVVSKEGMMESVRGYRLADKPLIMFSGICSGFMSVMVLGLYLSGPEVMTLYRNISFMWFLLPLLMYWLLHIWLMTIRGEMHDDPIVFAMKDRVSFVVMIVAILIVLYGA